MLASGAWVGVEEGIEIGDGVLRTVVSRGGAESEIVGVVVVASKPESGGGGNGTSASEGEATTILIKNASITPELVCPRSDPVVSPTMRTPSLVPVTPFAL